MKRRPSRSEGHASWTGPAEMISEACMDSRTSRGGVSCVTQGRRVVWLLVDVFSVPYSYDLDYQSALDYRVNNAIIADAYSVDVLGSC